MRGGDLNYGRLLRLSAARHGERPFLTFQGVTWSYRDFNERVNRLADALLQRNVQVGDRIAVRSFNSDKLIALAFASAKIGATFIPISTMVTDEDVERSVTVSNTSVYAFGPEFSAGSARLRKLPGIRLWIDLEAKASEIDTDGTTFAELVTQGSPVEPHVVVNDDSPAIILFTSGSTGTPKGTMKSFANLAWGAINRQLSEPRSSDAVELYAIPLAGIGFSNFVICDVLAGAHLVLMHKFDPVEARQLIDSHLVTNTFLAPTMMAAMIRAGGESDDSLTSVTALETAYEISPAQRVGAASAFSNARIMYGYGMTEGSMSRTPPEYWLEGGSRVGYPSGLDEIRIVDERGDSVSAGEQGEIQIAGPTTMMGYLGQSDDDTFTADGWLRSGDLGRLDSDGMLHFLGRVKDMIKTGGYNVFAADVERALAQCPGVASVAVIGVPHDYWGEAVVAVMTSDDSSMPVEIAAIKAHVAPLLAGYMIPKEYVIVDEIPLNPGGKIAKGVLRDRFAGLFAEAASGQ